MKQTIEEVAEREAEVSYPVLTHSDPENSPYIRSKETFKYGVMFGYNHAQKEIEQLKKEMFTLEDIENAFYNGWVYRGENYTFPKAKKEFIDQLITKHNG